MDNVGTSEAELERYSHPGRVSVNIDHKLYPNESVKNTIHWALLNGILKELPVDSIVPVIEQFLAQTPWNQLAAR